MEFRPNCFASHKGKGAHVEARGLRIANQVLCRRNSSCWLLVVCRIAAHSFPDLFNSPEPGKIGKLLKYTYEQIPSPLNSQFLGLRQAQLIAFNVACIFISGICYRLELLLVCRGSRSG